MNNIHETDLRNLRFSFSLLLGRSGDNNSLMKAIDDCLANPSVGNLLALEKILKEGSALLSTVLSGTPGRTTNGIGRWLSLLNLAAGKVEGMINKPPSDK
jgi:hypothetical protein